MSQRKTMTIGFLMILIGIQLNIVKTYTLTERATHFWIEHLEEPPELNPVQEALNSPYSQASYSGDQQANRPTVLVRAKQITPPDWICWPFIFVGVVFVIHGSVVRRQ